MFVNSSKNTVKLLVYDPRNVRIMTALLYKLITLLLIHYVSGAKILGIFHGAAYSHQQIGSKLLYELAARGHEVTSIVPNDFVPKHPIKNFRVIEIDFGKFKEEALPNVFEEPNRGVFSRLLFLEMIGLFLTQATFNQTNVENLIKSNEKFDMVIMEQFMNEAFRGFCYHFKAHCVVVSTIGASRWTNPQMGNPNFPSYVPENSLYYPSKMNFFQRFVNTYSYMFGTLLFNLYSLRRHNELIQKYFPNAPDINELYYNNSLMLLNSHESINPALPSVPNMIQIGGFHINPPKQLPKDLQEYLDGAKNGAIYFSMGSHIQPETMPKEKLNAITKVLGKLKQNVLWKIDNFTWHDKPAHVKVQKWFPQQEVLAHPNVVLFISHGGLLGTIETIYHGKPIVGIPILGDQEMNIAAAELNGFAKSLPFNDLDEKSLESAVNEVLTNPKYAENAKMRSRIMHDVPMKPLDEAMFWIEYVLRHNGAPHLRTSALDLYWYQLLSLDVLAFSLLILFVSCYSFCRICKIVASVYYNFSTFKKMYTFDKETLLSLLFVFQVTFGARILGVYQVPSYSHYQLGDVLLKELAKRGHDVTVISPYEEKEKIENYRTVVLTGAIEFYKDVRDGLIKRSGLHPFLLTLWNELSWIKYTEYTLNHTNVQKLLQSKETFDLVIVEHLYNNAHKGFCYHYNAPCIITSSMAATRLINRKIGNPSPPSFIPEPYQELPFKMNFFQRCHNFIAYIMGEISHHLLIMPAHDKLMHNTSPATSSLQNMIEIGGYHIKTPKPLPVEIQEYLDNSADGAIFLSLGSNILAKDVPKTKLDHILKTLSRVQQNVLWKWDDESLTNIPPNVRISKWYQQNDVLAHPNIKLFITHHGLLSSLETIYHGVPTVGIPIFGDQFINSVTAKEAGYSVTVPYNELNEEIFINAIYKIVNNSKYSLNAKKQSRILHDRPIKPLDNAMYWIEYVLRHKGAYFLRSPGLNLTWKQNKEKKLVDETLAVPSSMSLETDQPATSSRIEENVNIVDAQVETNQNYDNGSSPENFFDMKKDMEKRADKVVGDYGGNGLPNQPSRFCANVQN
ncbi:hypothetical protein FQR65_LT16780 [Abscondita terminalis]|nr:hypothetical protein FQR65_LT16780 [Abscondita terminalis]